MIMSGTGGIFKLRRCALWSYQSWIFTLIMAGHAFDVTVRWNQVLYRYSDSLLKELNDLSNEHDGKIDWNDGSDLWTQEHRDDFHRRAAIVSKKLQEELCEKYIVINHFDEYL